MLDHLIGLLVRVFNAQVTGANPLQVHTAAVAGWCQLSRMLQLLRAEENAQHRVITQELTTAR